MAGSGRHVSQTRIQLRDSSPHWRNMFVVWQDTGQADAFVFRVPIFVRIRAVFALNNR